MSDIQFQNVTFIEAHEMTLFFGLPLQHYIGMAISSIED